MSEILFEYVVLNNSVKVTAIDMETSVEAVVITPLGLTEKQMQKLAADKLNYILQKSKQ